MKKKKKKKKKIELHIQALLFHVFLILFFGVVGVIFLSGSPPATEHNTYTQNEIIEDVKIKCLYHRGVDKVYLFSKDHRYIIHTRWRDEDKTNELAEQILSSEPEFTITVWKHFTTNIPSIIDNGGWTYQVVDLRNDTDVYWNIEDHNRYQKKEGRITLILGIPLFIFFEGSLLYIMWKWRDYYFSDYYYLKRKKKKSRAPKN